MCVPVAAAATAVAGAITSAPFMAAATLGSAALGAYSIYRSGQAEAAQMEYQAQVAEVNRKVADEQARDALARGEQEQQRLAREAAYLRGVQRAKMSAMGLDLSFGSPADILRDTALLAAEDQATTMENAQREAQGYRISARNYRSQGGAYRAGAANARTASYIDMASTILSGAQKTGEVIDKYG